METPMRSAILFFLLMLSSRRKIAPNTGLPASCFVAVISFEDLEATNEADEVCTEGDKEEEEKEEEDDEGAICSAALNRRST